LAWAFRVPLEHAFSIYGIALTVTMNSGGGLVASSSGRPWAVTSSSNSTTTEAEMPSGTLGR
jgi:hypothetical protein